MNKRNPLTWLTDLSSSRRGSWTVLLLWIIAASLMGGFAPKLANLYDNNIGTAIGDQESVRATALLQREFPDQRGAPAIVVFHNPSGLSTSDYTTAERVSQWFVSGPHPKEVRSVLSIYTTPQAKSQLVSSDGTTMTMLVLLNDSSDVTVFSNVVKQIRDYTDQFDSHGSPLQVKVTGPAGVIADAVLIFSNGDMTLLFGTILVVLILLIAIYRSPLLVIIPLVAVSIALEVVNGIIGIAAQSHLFTISQDSGSIVTVLLFGAGTDYTIFIVSRYREELHREQNHRLALQNALHAVGGAITSSAGTVIVALLTLLLTVLGLYHVLGASLATAIVVMLLAGLTLVPAMLSIFGRAAFWPFIPKLRAETVPAHENHQARRGFWEHIATFVTKRPVLAVVCSSILLIVLALGNIGTPEAFNFLTGFRSPTPSAAGYKILATHFPAGTLAPFTVLIQLEHNGNAYQNLAAVDHITQAIAGVNNVSSASGPTRPDGKAPSIAPATLQQQFAQLPSSLTQDLRSQTSQQTSNQRGTSNSNLPNGVDPTTVGLYAATIPFISADNSTVALQVTLKDDPYSSTALDTMAPVRDAAKNAVAQSGLNANNTTIELEGVTPQMADTRMVSDHDKLITIPLVLLLIAIVLGLLLRSIVAPLYLLVSVTINYLAALGMSAFLFTRIQGDDGVAYAVPLYTFIFLVALGADYTIFLMSRVREETIAHGLVAGVKNAVSHTGGVITSAGLILASTFLVLATLPLRDLYQLGIMVALGILLDTFIVRGLLVPGIVVLLGDANWWPGKLEVKSDAQLDEEVSSPLPSHSSKL